MWLFIGSMLFIVCIVVLWLFSLGLLVDYFDWLRCGVGDLFCGIVAISCLQVSAFSVDTFGWDFAGWFVV